MNIFTLGFYGKQNLGDESYKDAFKLLFPQHNFIFSDHFQKDLVNKSDIVFLGGGNVIKPEYIKELEKVKNKKIYGFSVGIEKKFSFNPKLFEHIYARDQKSIEILKSMNVSCSLVPDAAFALQADPEKGKKWLQNKFKEEDLDLYENVIVIVVNSYMLHNNLSSLSRDAVTFLKFSYDLAKIADETNASFVFIPFGTSIPSDDRIANSWIASKCKYWKKNLMLFDRIDHKTALNVISAANLTISSRLHSTIFSYIAGTPFIDVTHHSKNESFLKFVEKEENSVSYWNFDSNKTTTLINQLINQPKHNEAKIISDRLFVVVTSEIAPIFDGDPNNSNGV